MVCSWHGEADDAGSQDRRQVEADLPVFEPGDDSVHGWTGVEEEATSVTVEVRAA
jgi:hypothetical protein